MDFANASFSDFVAILAFGVSLAIIAWAFYAMGCYAWRSIVVPSLAEWATDYMDERECDFTIQRKLPGNLNPVVYLLRWHVIPRNAFFNIYLHHTLSSDSDPELHDHPGCNISLILENGYIEIDAWGTRRFRSPGQILFRRARTAHRLAIQNWGRSETTGRIVEFKTPRPSISLFFMGPWTREWGFYSKRGWHHFQDFLAHDPASPRGIAGDSAPTTLPGTKGPKAKASPLVHYQARKNI